MTITTVHLIPNEKGSLPGKLADAELHFDGGILDGLKFIGFGIWERRTGTGRNVTFPARQYSVNGERRSFALLRPSRFDAAIASDAQGRIRDLVLDAFARYERAAAHPPAPGVTLAAWRYDDHGHSLEHAREAPATPLPDAPAALFTSDAEARAEQSPELRQAAPTLPLL